MKLYDYIAAFAVTISAGKDAVTINPLRLYDIAKKPCTEFLKTGGSAICRSDGLFESKQCDGTNCWCVNVLNGQPDKRTTQDRNIQLDCGEKCLGGVWTRWFNTDSPSSPIGTLRKGDYETLDRARLESRRVCERPIGFRVAIDNGESGPGLSTDQSDSTFELDQSGPTMGLKCVNNDQVDGSLCSDFKIKFCCPLTAICHWSEWAPWSECSKSCGSKGVRHRSRNILFQPEDIQDCPGRDYEVEECGTDGCCPTDCQWSNWTNWSECSKGCHGGIQNRTRTIVKEHSCGGICPGRDEQENECQPDCGIYGVWTGTNCECDHGYMGQCCRKQENMSAMLEADDAGGFINFQQRAGPMFGGVSSGTSAVSSVGLGLGGANGGGAALGTAADNPVCQKLINRSPPENGQLNCQRHRQTPTISCQVTCDKGYDFVDKPAHKYFCHPSGVTFTSPPGKTFDWPDCTRKHEKRGSKNEIWFEYQLDESLESNCRENLASLKKAFKSVDRPLLDSSIMPGFHFFTRIRLRCGNRDEVMRIGRDKEIEEIVSKNITTEARETSWARSTRVLGNAISGPSGLSLDRSDHSFRTQVLEQLHDDKTSLLDERELKALKRKKEARRARKRTKRLEAKSERKSSATRFTRSLDNSGFMLIEMRLLEFPTEPRSDLEVGADRASLVTSLRDLSQSGKLDLVEIGPDSAKNRRLGFLKRIQIAKKEIEQNRCLRGEVQRLNHLNQEYCVQCPKGTYQVDLECLPCPMNQYNSATGQLKCTKCPINTKTSHLGSKQKSDCN